MTTTVVRDSIVGDNWLYQTAQAVPMQRVLDEKTGQPTGDILTGPVRLAFETLFELPQPTPQNQNPKYGAMLLFTPYTDFSILYEEYYAVCAREFADMYDAPTQQYYGLHSPFRNQAEKLKFGGFTPGCTFITCTSKFKPPVVDARMNPIVDRSKVYAGVWAICSINPYAYKDPRKKGVGFGLQNVMIIGDDTKFGGTGADPTKTFKGVSVAAPITRPDMAQRMAQPPGGAPGAPAGGVPQQHYQPPAGGAPAYQAPAAPAAAYPPVGAVPPYAPPSPDEDMSFLN